LKKKVIVGGVVFLGLLVLSIYLSNRANKSGTVESTNMTENISRRIPTKEKHEENNSSLKVESTSTNVEFSGESTTELEKSSHISVGKENYKLIQMFIQGFYEFDSLSEKNELLESILSESLFKQFEITTDSQAINIQPKIIGIDIYDKTVDDNSAVAIVDLNFEGVNQSMIIKFKFVEEGTETLISEVNFFALKTE
jgi:hypothetical protein